MITSNDLLNDLHNRPRWVSTLTCRTPQILSTFLCDLNNKKPYSENSTKKRGNIILKSLPWDVNETLKIQNSTRLCLKNACSNISNLNLLESRKQTFHHNMYIVMYTVQCALIFSYTMVSISMIIWYMTYIRHLMTAFCDVSKDLK